MAFNVYGVIQNNFANRLVPAASQVGIEHGSITGSLANINAGAKGQFRISGSTNPVQGSQGSVIYTSTVGTTTVTLRFYFEANGKGTNTARINTSHPQLHTTNTSYVGPTNNPIDVTYTVGLVSASADDDDRAE